MSSLREIIGAFNFEYWLQHRQWEEHPTSIDIVDPLPWDRFPALPLSVIHVNFLTFPINDIPFTLPESCIGISIFDSPTLDLHLPPHIRYLSIKGCTSLKITQSPPSLEHILCDKQHIEYLCTSEFYNSLLVIGYYTGNSYLFLLSREIAQYQKAAMDRNTARTAAFKRKLIERASRRLPL